MLADAIRAEAWRFSRNRTAAFWSVMFLPAIGLALGVMGELIRRFLIRNTIRIEGQTGTLDLGTSGTTDMGQVIVDAATGLANPVILLFILIGAATIYAGDYRWETWRLVSARNSRVNLLLGKLMTVAGVTLVAMALIMLSDVMSALLSAGVGGRTLRFGFDGADAGHTLAYFGLAWVRVVQVLMMALLTAVVTRSLLATLFVPIIIVVAQSLLPLSLIPMQVMPDSWISMLMNPGAGYDALKGWVAVSPGEPPMAQGLLTKGVVTMALWTLLPLAGALAWFQRQDLSKE